MASYMSSMEKPEPHEVMVCPYNMAHLVEHYRMHIHLQKCRKQHPKQDKAICKYDATHVVNEAEIEFHLNTCPKRYLFDTQVYITDDDHRPPVEIISTPNVQSEETWDDENVSYQPETSKKGHIITKIKGATPAERRKHRMEGIKTFRPLGDQ